MTIVSARTAEGFEVIEIIGTTTDHAGVAVRSAALPIRFADRGEAVTFLRNFMKLHYRNGYAGYDLDEDYWWGCANDHAFEVDRYVIREREHGTTS